MDGKAKDKLLTKKSQPIKTITHQDIYATKETLEKLQSWKSALEVLNTFFDYHCKEPLNKKEIIQQYHANSRIFSIFFEDFINRTSILEKQLEDLRTREKVRN